MDNEGTASTGKPIVGGSVRTLLPEADRRAPPGEMPVYPVLDRTGRLVLLAWFDEFVALRDAGARFVTVWQVIDDPGVPLEDYAIAFMVG